MKKTLVGVPLTLGDVLTDCDRDLWAAALYLPRDEPWTLLTRCMLLSPDSVENEEDEEPESARRAGLAYALSVQDVLGIVANARAQNKEAGPTELLAAFLFYYDHDAFILFADRN